MWLRATSPMRASSTRPALRCISRPARHTARTPLKMDASFSSSGQNAPRRRLPISPTSPSHRKKLLSGMGAGRLWMQASRPLDRTHLEGGCRSHRLHPRIAKSCLAAWVLADYGCKLLVLWTERTSKEAADLTDFTLASQKAA